MDIPGAPGLIDDPTEIHKEAAEVKEQTISTNNDQRTTAITDQY